MGWRELTSSAASDWIAVYGLLIQSGAVLVSGIGVVVTLIWSKHIACLRATLDIVLTEQTDQGTIKNRTAFVALRDAGHLAKWADPQNTHGEEAATIRAVLNRYELVAIGIKKGALHEQSYRDWCRTTLVKDWTACKPLVIQRRQNDRTSTYFCEFEGLARKWAIGEEQNHV